MRAPTTCSHKGNLQASPTSPTPTQQPPSPPQRAQIVASGYSGGDEPGSHDADQVAAFSNPPPNHILLTTKFDTRDALMDALNKYCASAYFSIIIERSSNYIKNFGASRLDLACARGKIRKQTAHSRQVMKGYNLFLFTILLLTFKNIPFVVKWAKSPDSTDIEDENGLKKPEGLFWTT
ncbi:hypothetical protein B0T16DRAFT_460297 [Cercophora newfieldiana]|uniref:Uncharacterized protein n=1 Tax=Cercophora newfieldiana TaxID=92897 RepID=A0AA39Y1D8_9PEZI|nr:hypothetical protein B0T16DRAFT_460297 [Cercophora newfieldiana]